MREDGLDYDAPLDTEAVAAQAITAEKAVSEWFRRRGCQSVEEEYAALPALLAEIPNALDSPTVRGYLKALRHCRETGAPAPADVLDRFFSRRESGRPRLTPAEARAAGEHLQARDVLTALFKQAKQRVPETLRDAKSVRAWFSSHDWPNVSLRHFLARELARARHGAQETDAEHADRLIWILRGRYRLRWPSRVNPRKHEDPAAYVRRLRDTRRAHDGKPTD